MTFLIIIALTSSGSAITTQSIKFESNLSCLQAMQKLIDMEGSFKIKAVCVKE
jgi:hypothetical protein